MGPRGNGPSGAEVAASLRDQHDLFRSGLGIRGKHGAVPFFLDRAYELLIEMVQTRGISEVVLPDDQWALIANSRGTYRLVEPGSIPSGLSRLPRKAVQLGLPNDIVAVITVVKPEVRAEEGRAPFSGLRLALHRGADHAAVSIPRGTEDGESPIDQALRLAREAPERRRAENRENAQQLQQCYAYFQARGNTRLADGVADLARRHGYHITPAMALIALLGLLAGAVATASAIVWRIVARGTVMTDPGQQGQPTRRSVPPGRVPLETRAIASPHLDGVLEVYGLDAHTLHCVFSPSRIDRASQQTNLSWVWSFAEAGVPTSVQVTATPEVTFRSTRPLSEGTRGVTIEVRENFHLASESIRPEPGGLLSLLDATGTPVGLPASEVVLVYQTDVGTYRQKWTASASSTPGVYRLVKTTVPPPRLSGRFSFPAADIDPRVPTLLTVHPDDDDRWVHFGLAVAGSLVDGRDLLLRLGDGGTVPLRHVEVPSSPGAVFARHRLFVAEYRYPRAGTFEAAVERAAPAGTAARTDEVIARATVVVRAPVALVP